MSNSHSRRRRREKDTRGQPWVGNTALKSHVLRVLRERPLPRDEDITTHFQLASDKKSTAQRCVSRLISSGRAEWTKCPKTMGELLVAIAS